MNWIRNKWRTLDLGWTLLVVVLVTGLYLAAYNEGLNDGRKESRQALAERPEPPVLAPAHVHQWGKWGQLEFRARSWNTGYDQQRQCLECGWGEVRRVPDVSK